MKQIPWERVLEALRLLGCAVVTQTDFQVTVCRGATKLQRIRKLSPVPVIAQRRILENLSFNEDEFLAALAAAQEAAE